MATTEGTRLAGQGAVVTGSARGIGRDIARRFAREGARLVIADVQEESARSVVAEIVAAGGAARAGAACG
ncbi:MAG: SDR family NAD(P)-dependent oxidoreductase [Verrucomicrobia bacterium]|nr:SDR family NAD(P)-dependent oxidoreductase [Verrucomicrobiota bacterium]